MRGWRADCMCTAREELCTVVDPSQVKDFQKMAKDKLGIELEGGDTSFTFASLFQKKRQGEMNAQVGA